MLKRILCVCLTCIACIAGYAQGNGNGGGGFDPATPDDPQTPTGQYWLNVDVSPLGAGSLDFSRKKVDAGDSIWIYTYPNGSYKFEQWTCNGEVISKQPSFLFVMPAKDTQLTAYYTYDPQTPDDPQSPETQHTLTLKSDPVGAGYFDASVIVMKEGSSKAIYAYPNNGYEFSSWKSNGKIISSSNPLQYVMGTKDAELTAVFEYNPSTPSDPGANYWNKTTGVAVIDAFERGKLWETLDEKTGHNVDAVKDLTVAGDASSSDLNIMSKCKNLLTIDLSRTYGYSDVPNSAAENNTSLKKVILPSCIGTISAFAFGSCTSLTELLCYATTPPALNENAFFGIDKGNLTIKVPASAVLRYRNANVWKNLSIAPMDDESRSIQINLPEGSASKYKNMVIQLTNDASGESYTNVVNDRVSYVFNNLLKGATYTAELKTQQDVVLATIPDIAVAEDKSTVVKTFEDIKDILTATVKVIASEEDVTDQATISWKDANGNYIKQDSQVTGVVEGTQLTYSVKLPQALAMQYATPADVTVKIDETTAAQTVTLSPFESVQLTGEVKASNGTIIPSANVTVSQSITGLYPSTTVTKTDAQGKFSLKVLKGVTNGVAWGDATITVSANDYIANTVTVTADNLGINQVITLKALTGATLNVALLYKKATDPGQTSEEVEYSDYGNVSYALYNESKGGEQIVNFNVKYPTITLLEHVDDGDKITVVASSLNKAFNTVKSECTIANQTADVQIHIVGLGGVKATYQTKNNATDVAVLYTNDGEFIKKVTYTNQTTEFTNLEDGTYRILSMAQSDMFNDFQRLASLDEAGLKNMVDYVLNKVTVESGIITPVVNQTVPFFDATKVYYTGDNTSFTASTNSLIQDQYLTLKANIDFRSQYTGRISNLCLLVDLPKTCTYTEGSLMFGESVSSVACTIDENNRITIPLKGYEQSTRTVRFCITPSEGGDYAPNAFVQFTCDDKDVLQPIGNAPFTVKDLSIEVPEKVGIASVPVSGTAKKGSLVSVYDGDVLLGQTTALQTGAWNTVIELQNTTYNSVHSIYAKVVNNGIEEQTETKTLTFLGNLAVIYDVHLYHNNPDMGRTYDIKYDFQNPSNKPGNYIYCLNNRVFTFKIDVDTTRTTEDLKLIVTTAKGNKVTLDTYYDLNKHYYYTSGEFGNGVDGDLPINVAISEKNLGTVASGNANCGFAIDPSGYVYEAVHSNRVEGVKAAIYYREEKDGEYTEHLWDASEYAQENPLFTDEDGMYRWDVPTGEWQVRFEKDGYQNTKSEWLPVPPPQLEINVPMTSSKQPEVSNINAYEQAVEVTFKNYMDPSTLNYLNITLTKTNDKETSIIKDITPVDTEEGYCKKIRVEISDENITTQDQLLLTISQKVQSYAGVQMAEDYIQELSVKKEVKEIRVDNKTNVIYNPALGEQPYIITVSTLPAAAAVGKTMCAVSSSDMVVTVAEKSVVIDENGQAKFTLTGQMPGYANINFSIVDENVTGKTEVNVTREYLTVEAPVATKADGSEVYHNSSVVLTTGTKNAKIYYTVDGTDPSESNGTLYTQPIVIDKEMTIKAIGICDGYKESEVKTYSYTIRKTSLKVDLVNGWNWISYNFEGNKPYTELLKDQIDDLQTIYGKNDYVNRIGDELKGQCTMTNTQAYKVKMNTASTLARTDYEANAIETPISLTEGLNWIGYPVSQVTDLNEAFAYATPSEGDAVVTLDGGQAHYDGTNWIGDLKTLKPGVGYMYYAQNDMTFTYNNNLVSTANARYAINAQNETDWTCDVHEYPNVMCVVANINENGTPVEAGTYNVAAFCDGECRGIGSWQDGKLMISVHGELSKEIEFIARKVDEMNDIEINETIKFSDKELKGTLSEPYNFTIGTTGIGEIQSTNSAKGSQLYDLTGRHISNSNAKGVFISNGHKYVNR